MLVSFSSLSCLLFPRALPLNQQLPPCLEQPGILIYLLSKQQNPKSQRRNNSPKTQFYHSMAREQCSSKMLRVNNVVKVSVQSYFNLYLEKYKYKAKVGYLLNYIQMKVFIFSFYKTEKSYWNVIWMLKKNIHVILIYL